MSGTHNPFNAAQLAELRRALGLDPGEQVTGAMVLCALEAAQVVNDEAAYLVSAHKLGWLRWELTDSDRGQWDGT